MTSTTQSQELRAIVFPFGIEEVGWHTEPKATQLQSLGGKVFRASGIVINEGQATVTVAVSEIIASLGAEHGNPQARNNTAYWKGVRDKANSELPIGADRIDPTITFQVQENKLSYGIEEANYA